MDDSERYPIGRVTLTAQPLDAAARRPLIEAIDHTPAAVTSLVSPLADRALDLRYREGGWTVRQVVHHLADSHMNAYTRVKMALTEDNPSIKLYDEKRWAELADNAAPVSVSLGLLASLHHRWVMLFRSLDEAAFRAPYVHPVKGTMTVNDSLVLYAWHGRHHTAHIENALRKGGVAG